MIKTFKEHNDSWGNIQVVMTDKDMTERGVFKSKMPQINLEIYLFHVLRAFGRKVSTEKIKIKDCASLTGCDLYLLRAFGRKVSTEKIKITPGERSTVLDLVQEITYARDEASYDEKYSYVPLCLTQFAIMKT